MNAVGKMLVVLQLCLSLLFVCFAGATFALQARWQDIATKAEEKIDTLQNDLNDALADREQKVTEANTDRDDAIRNLEIAQTELRTALQEKDTADGLLAEAIQARDKAQAESIRATAEAASRHQETLSLREETTSLQKSMAVQLAEIRQKDSQILDLTGTVAILQRSEEILVNKNADLSDLLRVNNIDPDKSIVGPVPEPVDKVDGYVVARRQNRSQTLEFVQITIGSDDKIKEGMTLYVYRNGTYVCDIEIQRVSPDSAVGIVVASTRRSNTQKGDRVTTQL